MPQPPRVFGVQKLGGRRSALGDVAVLLGVATVAYLAARLAWGVHPGAVRHEISLSPSALPWYALFSVGRMTAAYILSLAFALVFGTIASNSRQGERVLVPFIDILQCVPILSFLPLVFLSLRAIMPHEPAAQIASIILIFTSQAWDLTFGWYQSRITIPKDMREASTVFRFPWWLRFTAIELPFAAFSLIWNSMMSWSGGWFFLMAAEIFRVGEVDFRLPGLGAYLQEAAIRGDIGAILWGLGTLVVIIVALDQLVWRPLLAWGDRFKLEMVEGATPPESWFYEVLRSSRFLAWFGERVVEPVQELCDRLFTRGFRGRPMMASEDPRRPWGLYGFLIVGGAALLFGGVQAADMIFTVPAASWWRIAVGVGATLLRVAAATLIALVWTVPLGVAIGTNRRLSNLLQPIVQITASIPATALFPVMLLFVADLPGGLSAAAVLLMLLGTQWYLLFNVIAGASAIPQDLKYTTILLHLSRWQRWRTLILPAIFPYVVTGAVTASGGAWNASVVAEYVEFGGTTLTTTGIGAVIAEATAGGDFPLLLAATLSMVFTVVAINRLLWRPLYRRAEEDYRME